VRQLFQNLKNGQVTAPAVPAPSAQRGAIVVRTACSLVSPGTERMIAQFGKAGFIEKARSQPDKVRQVIDKIQTDGIIPTAKAVLHKLDQPLPLGYSAVGTVTAVGEGVARFRVGDRVVCNGNHAEAVAVGENLAARIPEGVTDETAAFTVLGAIGMQGVRLLAPEVGERYVVMGLGVIGLLSVQILKAAGCQVLATDFNRERVALAERYGARGLVPGDDVDPVEFALSWSGGDGVDGVLICASTESMEPIRQSPKMCRKRGKVVLVGVVGLELDRTEFFKREVTFQVSCSYGPGRYEAAYEKKGLDYPIGFVRWTEQRNFEAVLGLMAEGKIVTGDLLSAVVPFKEATARYDELLADPDALGILFRYEERELKRTIAVISKPKEIDGVRIGVVGAGNFASGVLLPLFKELGGTLREVAAPSGKSAGLAAIKFGALEATSDVEGVILGDKSNAVVIASRHDSHAELVVKALGAGKHVFVEKPLATTLEELQAVERAVIKSSGQVLVVDFNRRFSPLVTELKRALKGRAEPLTLSMTVNAGRLPSDSWVMDESEGGGRVTSEVCHFIDLFVAIAGAPVTAVVSTPLRESKAEAQTAIFSLTLADGSIGTIQYLSNSSRKLPKERLEVHSGGRTAVIDNFRSIKSFGFKNLRSRKLWSQAKGHRECISAFLAAVSGREIELPAWDELRNVTVATIAAKESARDGVLFRVS
jgi:predicted dehydrogenase/threonine dehydrogenase-like Zn-dependent dehydrogenase